MSIKMLFTFNFNKLIFYFKKILFGFLIGASVIIPGMSGGTTAILLGVFEEIIVLSNSIIKKPLRSMFKLLPFLIGGCIGLFSVSTPISYISKNFPVEFSFFIAGIIVGGSYVFLSKNNISNKNKPTYILVGLSVVLLQDIIFKKVNISKSNVLIIIFVALLSSIAFILPGISFTNVLIMFGKYNEFITAVKSFDVRYLCFFLSFLIIGTLIFVKLFTYLYSKYKDKLNLILLGMILASLPQIYVGFPNKNNIIQCILLFIGAGLISFMCAFFEK